MSGVKQEVQVQTGLDFDPGGAAVELGGGKGRRAGDSSLSEEYVRTLAEMLDAHGAGRQFR